MTLIHLTETEVALLQILEQQDKALRNLQTRVEKLEATAAAGTAKQEVEEVELVSK